MDAAAQNHSPAAFRFSSIVRGEIALGWNAAVRSSLVVGLNAEQQMGIDLARWLAPDGVDVGEVEGLSDAELCGLLEEMLREQGRWNVAALAQLASWCIAN